MTPDGTVLQVGGVTEDNPGLDLTGLIVGHEGTFGIATSITREPGPRPGRGPDVSGGLRISRFGDRDRQRHYRRGGGAGGAGRCSTTS